MLEEVLVKTLNDNGILYVKNTGESIRALADADLKKHGFNPDSGPEKCANFSLETEESLTYEEMDRIHEIMTGNINFPLYRITSFDINGFMIKYERRTDIEEIILCRLMEDGYKEIISVQTHGKFVDTSTKYDEEFNSQVWKEFTPHEQFDERKLVKRIFELAGIKADP